MLINYPFTPFPSPHRIKNFLLATKFNQLLGMPSLIMTRSFSRCLFDFLFYLGCFLDFPFYSDSQISHYYIFTSMIIS